MATFSKYLSVTSSGVYTLEMTLIPTGSTVTPVNDIQTWLHCANIWNKNYTTISQVLNDTSTLNSLIQNTNAQDYMVRSTNWASSVCGNQTAMTYIGTNNSCANKLLSDSTWCSAICNSTYFEKVLTTKIPAMTSVTAPSGQVKIITNSGSGTDVAAGNGFYQGFDGDDSTFNYIWQGGNTTYAVEYIFPSAVMVKKLKLKFKNNDRAVTFTFQRSENNSSWTTLKSYNAAAGAWLEKTDAISNNNIKCRYYRVLAPSSPMTYNPGNGNVTYECIYPYTIQMWGRA